MSRPVKKYCGTKAPLPQGYDQYGDRYTCLKKGFGTCKYKFGGAPYTVGTVRVTTDRPDVLYVPPPLTVSRLFALFLFCTVLGIFAAFFMQSEVFSPTAPGFRA